MKAELHQRADDLSDALWNIVVKRKEAANTELTSQKDAKFAEWQAEWLVSLFMHLMQLELERFVQVIKFVHEVLLLQSHLNIPALPDVSCKLPVPLPVTFLSLPNEFKSSEKYHAWAAEAAKLGIHDESKDVKKDGKDAKKDPKANTAKANAPKETQEDHVAIVFSKLSESLDFVVQTSKSYGLVEPVKSEIVPSKAPAKEKKEEKEAREAKEKAEQVAFDQEHEELMKSPVWAWFKEIREAMLHTLELRIQRLKSKCEEECLALKLHCDKLWKNLDDSIGETIKLENSAIENLSSLIKVLSFNFSYCKLEYHRTRLYFALRPPT